MDITSHIKAQCRVVAALDGDTQELSVSVFAQAEYAPGRTTTAQVATSEIPLELIVKLRDALTEIQLAAERRVGPRLQHAIFKSTEIAVQMGEL